MGTASMFGIFSISADKISAKLSPIIAEVGQNIVAGDFLGTTKGSGAQFRFNVGAHLFANLLCQDRLCEHDSDRTRALAVCKMLTEGFIQRVAPNPEELITFGSLVVWDIECRDVISPFVQRINSEPWADISQLRVPFGELLRGIVATRTGRLTRDLVKGAIAQSEKGPWSLSWIMPASCSLLFQVTGDYGLSEDEKVVAEFAASLVPQYMIIETFAKNCVT